jgi:hypothetical protein
MSPTIKQIIRGGWTTLNWPEMNSQTVFKNLGMAWQQFPSKFQTKVDDGKLFIIYPYHKKNCNPKKLMVN